MRCKITGETVDFCAGDCAECDADHEQYQRIVHKKKGGGEDGTEHKGKHE